MTASSRFLKDALSSKLQKGRSAATQWLDLSKSLPTLSAERGHSTCAAVLPDAGLAALRSKAAAQNVSVEAICLSAARVLIDRYARRDAGEHLALHRATGVFAVPVVSAGQQTIAELLSDSEGWLSYGRPVQNATPYVSICVGAIGTTQQIAESTQLMLDAAVSASQVVAFGAGRTDLFGADALDKLMGQFLYILDQLCVSEDPSLAGLSVLPPEQQAEVLRRWNTTDADHEIRLVHEWFEEQVRRSPAAIAVMHGETSLTYDELNRSANQLARHLRGLGVGPDVPVGLCFERGPLMLVALLAIVKAGGAYLPLDPDYPRDRLQSMLTDASPEWVLTQQKLGVVVQSGHAMSLVLDEQGTEWAKHEPENLCSSDLGLDSQHAVYVIYTSGSTGRPKGTVMHHAPLSNLIEWHRKHLPTQQNRRTLQFASIGFDVAFQEIFSTLCTGGTLVLSDEWIRRDPRALIGFLEHHSIERLFIPPMVLQAIAECFPESGATLHSLRDIITAGEPLRISAEISGFFAKLRACRLHNHYGPTETHVATTASLSVEPREWATLPAIGHPISNTRIYILDTARRPVPAGVTGEIYISGAALGRGYWKRPELTAERFLVDPFNVDAQSRMYRTGDLARYLPEGAIEYLGRNDHQVKIRGFRIELGEIEARLAAMEDVRESVAMVREDPTGEKRLVAYVVTSKDVDADVLRRRLQSELPEHMVPFAIVPLQALPLTINGKVDRRALPAPELTQCAAPYVPPRNPTEEALCRIWQEVLGLDRVGVRDNFFYLGGHSLIVFRMLAAIRKEFGVDLPVRMIFEIQDLQGLAACLDVTAPRRSAVKAVDQELETFEL